jgi:hypothetical protein
MLQFARMRTCRLAMVAAFATLVVAFPGTVSASSASCASAILTVHDNAGNGPYGCAINGTPTVVVSHKIPLRLGALTLTYQSIRAAKRIGPSPVTATAHGGFEIVRVRVFNHANSPQIFIPENQTALLVGKRDFSVSVAGDSADVVGGRQFDQAIEPRQSAVGDLVYDLPLSTLKAILVDGADLIVVGFGEDLQFGSIPALGIMQLPD